MSTGYYAEGLFLSQFPGTEIIESDDIGVYAIELIWRGWRVFPLRGKIPAIPKSRGGRGVLDATTDYAQVNEWWSGRYAGCNIGVRLPDGLFVLDVDPRHDGHLRLAELEKRHGRLPETLKVYSGRGDGGVHHYFTHPGGKISSTRIGEGLDVKTSAGYVVAPPSLHPDSGLPYRWERHDVTRPPRWLTELLLPEVKPAAPRKPYTGPAGGSIADDYSANTSWKQILEPHQWDLVRGDGDGDGSCWRHPTATSPISATVRHGNLFVYSPNTPFEVTEPSDPHGVTRFRAYAVLEHDGDMGAAARALRAEADPIDLPRAR